MPISLLDGLPHAARNLGEQVAYGFISQEQNGIQTLSYQQLYRKVLYAAHDLTQRSEYGDRVLLLYPPGLDFLAAYYACLTAGRIAVPVFPPASRTHFSRLALISADAGARLALTTASLVNQVTQKMANTLKENPLTITSLNDESAPCAFDVLSDRFFSNEKPIFLHDIALLQYTSGSTGSPKGVEVTHQGIVENLEDMDRAWQHDADSVSVSWLPVFHDMGLVYGVMMPLFKRFPGYLMAPKHFVQKPLDWLRAIYHLRGTHCAAPNFAYEMCTQAVQKAGVGDTPLDLSSWRVAVNGAEPIRPATLIDFQRAFAPYGFDPNTLCPGYGLAEYTLEVTTMRRGEGPVFQAFDRAALEQGRAVPVTEDGNLLVACGQAGQTSDLRIVDVAERRPVPDGTIGEIWVHGPSCARGYFGDQAKSDAVFGATLVGSERRYLRTGDYGFVFEGRLFVTGRLKDLIICNGRNIFPQDLELTAFESHEALRVDGCAAVSVSPDDPASGRERLLIVAELSRGAARRLEEGSLPCETIFSAVRRAVSEAHEVEVDHLVLIKPATLPRTSSGKVRRALCGKLFREEGLAMLAAWSAEQTTGAGQTQTCALDLAVTQAAQAPDHGVWLALVTAAIEAVLAPPHDQFDADSPLATWGLNSLKATRLAGLLSERSGVTIEPTAIYNHPTARALAALLAAGQTAPRVAGSAPKATDSSRERVAVLGMACRFPGAADLQSFQQLLAQGSCAVNDLPAGRTDLNPAMGAAGYLDEVRRFDAAFFGISAAEAEVMDPQQRLLLETAAHAFEHAGLKRETLTKHRTGVFAAVSSHDYERLMLQAGLQPSVQSGLGSQAALAANRISYAFDLRGPSLTIDTACSSSLVALHQALRALRAGDCDIALVAGVQLYHDTQITQALDTARMLSPRRRCRTFDADADGYVRGEGCGAVVLTRASLAKSEAWFSRAEILGSAVNQDGRSNGITAPNGAAQAAVMRAALRDADVAPHQIGYVECHGTGTPLGDPIEIAALTGVLGQKRDPQQPCRLGSVKTNIGHLEAAAGMAGLIKTLLILQGENLPAHLHLQRLNPAIHLPAGFVIADQNTTWPRGTSARYAGVSSFGIGGTNAHVVLCEAAAGEPTNPIAARGNGLLLVSAKDAAALKAQTTAVKNRLEVTAARDWEALCAASALHRDAHDLRCAVWAETREQALTLLQQAETGETASGWHSGRRRLGQTPRLAMMFTGSGSQYAGMGRLLFEHEPVFRETLRDLDQKFAAQGSASLIDAFYGDNADTPLHAAATTQIGVFALQIALFRQLLHWGLTPAALVGHSLGEIAAATCAGMIALDDAVALVAARARCLQQLSGSGAMLAVFSDETQVSAISQGLMLDLAAVNGPRHRVLSGPEAKITSLEERLREAGVRHRRLKVDQALHSAAIETIVPEFRKTAASIPMRAPKLPFYSCLTGTRIETATDAEHWCRHLREPVQFEATLTAMIEAGFSHFLEVGPRPVLRGLAADLLPQSDRAVALLDNRQPDWQAVNAALANLWCEGFAIDWAAFYNARAGLDPATLPLYPFQGKNYWFQTPVQRESTNTTERTIELTNQTATTANDSGAVLVRLREMIAPLLKCPAEDVDGDAPFLEMGADSLVLADFLTLVERHFGIKIPVGDLFEQMPSARALAEFLSAQAAPPAAPATTVPTSSAATAPAGNTVAQLLATHEKVMAQHHQLMQALAGVAPTVPTAPTVAQAPHPSVPAPAVKKDRIRNHMQARRTGAALAGRQSSGLDAEGQAALEQLIETYTRRTATSKRHAAQHRPHLADYRGYLGFRFSTKEMLYEIEVDRATGATVVDVDGNQYRDITMGFGVNLFGHNPDFVEAAMREELARGSQLGLRSRLAGTVAERFCRLTGHERVAFTSSGTEAVMAAIRLARRARGRDRIVVFEHAYHGHGDGVLARRTELEGQVAMKPVAPGIPAGAVADALVLPYDDPASLATIREQAEQLGAVLVEPVQSARPELQPVAFLRQLRELTQSLGIPLILDEMITGFRVHPAGVQGLWGIKADIATYGKTLGGGMAIGAVAGDATWMDGIDGGSWSYGDGSYPRVETTFMAGTYQMQALTMAATNAVLTHLEEAGPALQENLNRRTEALVRDLNQFFREQQLPMEMVRFGSLFRFKPSGGAESELFFYYLMMEGVYVRNVRNCFLSTAHEQSDIDAIKDAVFRAAQAMRRAGFFPKTQAGERRLPATEAQRRLFALATMDEAAEAAYVERLALAFDGDLDAAVLEKALAQLVHRHDALRTSFSEDGATQIIAAQVPVSLIEHEVPDTAALKHLTEELATQAPAVTDAPLFRFHLLRAGDQRVLLMLFHHIAIDGLSLILLFEELSACVNAYAAGQTPNLAAPVSLDTYQQALQTYRNSADNSADTAFWQAQGAFTTTPVSLPAYQTRPTRFSYRGARHSELLPADLRTAVRNTARQHQTTEFMVLFAAYALWVLRLTERNEAVFGVPVSGRRLGDTRRCVGYLAHLLPVRIGLDGINNGSSWLRHVRQTLLAAFRHERLPFAEMAAAQDLKVPAGFGGLLNLTFNLDRLDGLPDFNGKPCRLVDLPLHHAKVDLHLDILDDGRDLTFKFEYAADLYNKDMIQSFAAMVQTTLRFLAETPAQAVRSFPLATAQAVPSHDAAVAPADPTATLVDRFEAQVKRTPDAPAVSDGEHKLSYRELDEAANSLAQELIAAGVATGTAVPILQERNTAAVIAILAVLKAGGAYVPLDPTHAPARLARILQAVAAPLLVADPTLAHRCVPDYHGRLLDPLSSPGTATAPAPARDIDARYLAYIIYTSGSTGMPKGVAMAHHTAVAYFAQTQHEWGYAAGDVWACFHSLAFDFSVLEVFAPLLSGGKLVMVPYLVSRTPEELLPFLAAEHVQILCQTPTAFASLDAADRERHAAGNSATWQLQTLIFGGEALNHAALTDWFQRHPHCTVRNIYGATENCINATWRGITADETQLAGALLGPALGNNRVYVLDSQGRPLPVGVPGECFVGGNGVAAGYFRQPGLTAARFVPDPFSTQPGARLYRTGDRVCLRADGELEFLGRIDQQVQLRGFRVELGEIEAALHRHPAVKAAAVDLRQDGGGRPILVAWLVAEAGVHFAADGIRQFLRNDLPAYMLPNQVVTVDTLPMTANGKVDRAQLKADTESNHNTQTEAAPAPTIADPRQKALAAIWAEVLQLPHVSVDDHFFSLGGDSMSALALANRLRRDGLKVRVRDLLEHPTVAALAVFLADQSPQDTVPKQTTVSEPFSLLADKDRVRVKTLAPLFEDAAPLSESQAGILYHAELENDGAVYHDVLSFRVTAPLDQTRFQQALQRLSQRTPILRTVLWLGDGDQALQLVSREALIKASFIDAGEVAPQQLPAWLDQLQQEAVATPFKLDAAPLLRQSEAGLLTAEALAEHALVRVTCVKHNDNSFQLMLAFHHAVLDGWSVSTLLGVLLDDYRLLHASPEASNPTTRLGHIAATVTAEQQALEANEHAAFWHKQLADHRTTNLPGPSPAAGFCLAFRPAGAAEQRLTLDNTQSAALIDLARQWSCPLQSVLLAVHLRVLAAVTNQKQPTCGLIVPTRDESDGSLAQIGLMVNTLPFRVANHRADQAVSARDWIQAVHNQWQAVTPHRAYPLARLQQIAGNEVLFESVFNYIHFRALRTSVDGLTDQRFHGYTHFPLLAEWARDPWNDQLSLTLQYQPRRFTDAQIETYLAMHREALSELLRAPHKPLATGDLLPTQTMAALKALQPNPRPLECVLVHRLFERTAAAHPKATAVIDPGADSRHNYGQLEQQANQWAHHLIAQGIGPEKRVAVCMERNSNCVTAVLAVLKAGAAYVPLDPNYPMDRVQFMLRDSAADLVLTQGADWTRSLAELEPNTPVIDWHQVAPSVATAPSHAPRVAVTGDNLAYLIYTSGSTGRPKAVAMPHRVLANLIACQRRATLCESGVHTLWFASLCFDVHHQELFTAFAGGDAIVVANEAVRSDAQALISLLREQSVQRLFLPFVALDNLARVIADETDLPEALREIITAGEQLRYTPAIDHMLTRLPLCRLVNQYGPSETHVAAAWHAGEAAWPSLPPIGRPISNGTLWVLDDHLNPVPPGTPGELYIGGMLPARGYWRRPSATAAAFVPDPFATTAGARLYRSGDRVRLLPDGALEFLGRADEQVKIRGYRVEPGEVENVLDGLPGVHQAAVVAPRAADGSHSLHAYLVVAAGHSLDAEQVRRAAADRLPAWMVPTRFDVIDALPKTPSGKINRRLLRAGEVQGQSLERPFQAPRSETERILAEMWAEQLKLARVSRDAGFFELGGHSLSATRLVLQLRRRFDCDLPLRTLFEASSPAAMAEVLENLAWMSTGTAEAAESEPRVDFEI